MSEADLLTNLANAFSDMAKAPRQRDQKIDEIGRLLASLNPSDYPKLMENPAIEKVLDMLDERQQAKSPNDPPGTIYDAGTMAQRKKPWTERDLRLIIERGDMPIVEIPDPRKTTTITWNGLTRVIIADRPNWLEKCFADVYYESRHNERAGKEHADYMFRNANSVSDPSILNEGSMRVRAMVEKLPGAPELYRPGGGWQDTPRAVEGEGAQA